jgi:ABC-type multidrug transport system fused ATPase/permease subunit
MVLDKGVIKEFATPKELLRDDESAFYKMAKDANLV